MITSKDFDRIVYRDPRRSLKDKRGSITKILGFDSEAYITGEPFLFCTSLGDVIHPKFLPEILFEERYIHANFMLYNLKYDAGAILYSLSYTNLQSLWSTGRVKAGEYRYRYIPHKQLRIYHGKNYVTFWDISQFFKHGGHRLTLDSAATIYLEEKKLDMRTKRFKPEYVRRYWKAICRYCIQDAALAGRLGEYLVAKLEQFGITPTAIYSCASISFKYFADHSRIVTAYRWWKEEPELLKFAVDAYEGGKFEVTARGAWGLASVPMLSDPTDQSDQSDQTMLFEYDLSSAYPYEISRLVDISNAKTLRTVDYQEKAVYGYLRCLIDNPAGLHLPCGIMVNNVRIYPAGRCFLTITKGEYDYLLSIGVKVEILDAYWLFVKSRRYPYASPVSALYSVKTQYKKTDKMLYDITKIVQNSFYGKCCQMIETPQGKVEAGTGWNPMYAAEITAGCRLKVTKIQNEYGADCLAVHTDSVLLTRPLPRPKAGGGGGGGIGEFEEKTHGPGLIVACGMYQVGDKCAFKGFNPNSDPRIRSGKLPPETWVSVLSKNRHKRKLTYRMRRVESWVEAMAKNHDKTAINVFGIAPKEIDLNCDVKRVWQQDITAGDLLAHNEQSLPKIRIEDSPPDYWHLRLA